jgi:membrane fusion protein, multidrug efflux system
MKKISLFALLSLALFSACQSSTEESALSAEQIKTQLLEKKSLLKQLEGEIADLLQQLERLDTLHVTPQTTVTVDTLVLSDFFHYVDLQATILPEHEVLVSPEISGRIQKLYVREGQKVARGQKIAELDVQTLVAQKAELLTQWSLAQDLLQRQEGLWKEKIGTELQYLEAKNNVERLEKSMATLDLTLEKATLYAPASGVVLQLNAKEGELASPGMPIASLVSSKELKLVAELPETYLTRVALGDQVQVLFPALQQEQSARIQLIGSVINPANRTFKIEARIQPDPKDLIKPNMMAKVKINDFSLKNTLVLPLPLVQQEISGKEYVMLVDYSGDTPKSQKRYIKTGKAFSNKTTVESGLEPGEIIVVEGARGLVSGLKLNILTREQASKIF